MADVYLIKEFIQENKCCVCTKENNCNILNEDIKCDFHVKPKLRKYIYIKTIL